MYKQYRFFLQLLNTARKQELHTVHNNAKWTFNKLRIYLKILVKHSNYKINVATNVILDLILNVNTLN